MGERFLRTLWLPEAQMNISLRLFALVLVVSASSVASLSRSEEQDAQLPKATIDGIGPDWVALGDKDFTNNNCDDDTWTWKDGSLHCTGKPVGVIRSNTPYKNFELDFLWQHLTSAGTSGVFVCTADESLKALQKV